MKWKQTLKSWLVVLAAVIGFGLAAPRASAGVVIHIGVGVPAPVPVVYHYDYYPDAEVYFDPDAGLYWWLTGGVWVSGPHAPAGIILGNRVQLDVDDRAPWHHHDVIVKHYPRHEHHEER